MTGGANGVMLKWYILLSCWYADNFGFVNNVLNMFNLSMDCYSKASQRITGKYLSVEKITETKLSLNVCISSFAAFNRWLCGSTWWYWLLCSVMTYYFRLFDASLSIMSRVALYLISDKYLVSFMYNMMISVYFLDWITYNRMKLPT